MSNVHNSKSKITGDSLLFNGIFLYNKIPDTLKGLIMKKFKPEIKNYIYNNLPHDKIVNSGDYG